MIAALFVERDGIYFGRDDIDPWDEQRDAREYDGPHPVLAHPPCARWGRYWSGGPSAKVKRKKGDDDGCFDAAFRAVCRFGGVLEHPEASHAWRQYNIVSPPRGGGWIPAGLFLGGNTWTCCVEQGHYGHKARKATWLLACGVKPPELIWGPSSVKARLDDGFHSAEERRRRTDGKGFDDGPYSRLSHRERAATPPSFAAMLIDIAAGAVGSSDT